MNVRTCQLDLVLFSTHRDVGTVANAYLILTNTVSELGVVTKTALQKRSLRLRDRE